MLLPRIAQCCFHPDQLILCLGSQDHVVDPALADDLNLVLVSPNHELLDVDANVILIKDAASFFINVGRDPPLGEGRAQCHRSQSPYCRRQLPYTSKIVSHHPRFGGW